MSMNVTLTPTLESLVKNKVAAGLYSSPSEVMNEALRMMQEQDNIRDLRLGQLRDEIAQGLGSGASEPWNLDTVKRKLHSRRTAKSPNQVQV